MNGQLIVAEHLCDYCTRKRANVILVQEPTTTNVGSVARFDFYPYRIIASGDKPGAAIIIVNPLLEVLRG